MTSKVFNIQYINKSGLLLKLLLKPPAQSVVNGKEFQTSQYVSKDAKCHSLGVGIHSLSFNNLDIPYTGNVSRLDDTHKKYLNRAFPAHHSQVIH